MDDLEQAKKHIRMRGTASYKNVSVKIVSLGDGFGVETTVDGDHRYPVEDPMPLPEAQALALAQLVEPRAGYVYTPTPPAPQKSTVSGRPYKSAGDLAGLYRRQGLDRYKAWDQYIIDTILQPRFSTDPVDAKVFYKFFDRLAG
jgi:hypothetical protein